MENNSNFEFLKQHDSIFYDLATASEQFFRVDPNTTLIKLRQLAESMSKDIASKLGIVLKEQITQTELIYQIDRKLSLDSVVKDLFHTLRKEGNKAVHEYQTSHKQAIDALRLAHKLAVWFHRTFGDDANFKENLFKLPADPTEKLQKILDEKEILKSKLLEANQRIEDNKEHSLLQDKIAKEFSLISEEMQSSKIKYEKLLEEKEAELLKTTKVFEKKIKVFSEKEKSKKEEKEIQQSLKRKAKVASNKINLTEEETREIIDIKLIEAGWEADTKNLDYRKGARPEVGKNMAIAEWPCHNPHTEEYTRADYVLFIGLNPVAVVEAKKFGNDVYDDIRQAEEYSRDINLKSVIKIANSENVDLVLNKWTISSNNNDKYIIPIVFSTNGREYQNQIKTKSGIWFRDVRIPTNKSRAIMAWFTPDEITNLLARDENKILDKISENEWGTLELRDYQKDAICKTEEAIVNKQRKVLIAMATGTGKTRTVIALMYRLLKAGFFKRILFLVDRGALGEQAQNAFSEIRPDGTLSFKEIYDVKELKDKQPDTKTKVHIATVQSMVNRVLASDDVIPIGKYDCIIVDEAHRGYTLDREMTEGEMELRDFNDYVSSYRKVLDYFDAVRIGLTATPAIHTTEIFGSPVYTYSYREAVIDGFLIDSEPPYSFDTELSTSGIHFDKKDEVEVIDVLGDSRTEILEDEMNFEVEHFNRNVLNENFNRVICEKLAKDYLDPTSDDKTLIFCVNDKHADLVVEQMKNALDKFHCSQENNTVMKITGAIRDPREAIREYKNEKLPNIAVTVDLLTTGIDVPEIVNLVFLRRVRSRILYEQMKGRATRLCPDINKDIFRIFDAVGLYKILEKVDTMKPIVQNVSVPITQLIDDLNNDISYKQGESSLDNKNSTTHAQNVHDELIVKLQRITRRTQKISDFPEAKESFDLLNALTQDKLSCNFNELPKKLKELSPKETGLFFQDNPSILGLMVNLRENLKINKSDIIISTHEDQLIGVSRGFGTNVNDDEIIKPEDYLDSFKAFIKENLNKIAAIKAVVSSPRTLTKKDLKALELMLNENNFSKIHLQEAWKKAKKEDIAASIIGHIRTAALGDPLIPYTERVDLALKKIKSSKDWNNNQVKWLELLAKQIKVGIIIDNESLQKSPFKEKGGRKRLEMLFDDKLNDVLDDFSTHIWEQRA